MTSQAIPAMPGTTPRRRRGRVRTAWTTIRAVLTRELRWRMRARRAFVVATVFVLLLGLITFGIYRLLSDAAWTVRDLEGLAVAVGPGSFTGLRVGLSTVKGLALALSIPVAAVPTLVFDEVDAGIGGGVAATVGRLLQTLGGSRQVLCVTHLPQVATFADAHFRVTKRGDAAAVHADVEALNVGGRIEELARMLAGSAITAKSRAHAKELLEQHRRR